MLCPCTTPGGCCVSEWGPVPGAGRAGGQPGWRDVAGPLPVPPQHQVWWRLCEWPPYTAGGWAGRQAGWPTQAHCGWLAGCWGGGPLSPPLPHSPGHAAGSGPGPQMVASSATTGAHTASHPAPSPLLYSGHTWVMGRIGCFHWALHLFYV